MSNGAYYHMSNSYFASPLKFGETNLFQIGRLYCNAGLVVSAHKHEKIFEITAVTSGKGILYTNGVPVEIKEGDLYLSLPFDTHEIISDTDELLQYDFLAFTTESQELSIALEQIRKELSDKCERFIPDLSIAPLISEALGELNSNAPYSNIIIKDLLEQIIVRVIRAMTDTHGINTRSTVSNAEALCYRAMSYIDDHIFSIRSLTEVSDAMNYNYSYLSNLFKKTTGIALMDYYRKKRIESARTMLKEKGHTITKTAELLGYTSVYAFSRAFKEEVGISPSQYKQS